MKLINKLWLKSLIEEGCDQILREMQRGYQYDAPIINQENKSILALIDLYFKAKKELLIMIERKAIDGYPAAIQAEYDGVYATCEPTYKWIDIKGDYETPGEHGCEIDYGNILITIDDELFND
jgi:hypothetical protein